MAITKVSTKNTKQELVDAYNQLAKEIRAAKASASEPASASSGGSNGGGNGELSIADIVERLKALTLSIGESSSSLQSALSAEATELQRLRAEADGYIDQLKTLHGIEVGPGTLAELIKQHGETAKAQDADLSEKRKAFEKEMSAAKAAWKREQQEHVAKTKEAAAQLEKSRQRDAQEYKYGIERQHKAENDVIGQARKAFAQELADLEERSRSEWAEREKAIAEREKELAELTKKSDAFEGELESATKKAEGEGIGIAKRQTKTQSDLKKKDNEAIQRVLELKIQSLQDMIGKQDAQIEELSRGLDSTRKQTTELAVKAIDGASNASSFAAIKEIALEQAKNTQKSK